MSKVFIGVGHGGADPGAVANGIKESYANLEVAKACADVLEAHGVDVMLSRTSDITEDLTDRIRECNAFKPDLAADIHHNAGGGDGAEVYHARNNTYDDALAKNILDEIIKIGQNSRGLKTKLTSSGKDYFGFIRQVTCPSVLIECAFLDSKDVKIIDTPEERKKMGEAIAKGFLKTLGITYKADHKKPEPIDAKSFLPARGYFMKGDVSPNVGKIAEHMYKWFPSYTDKRALGNIYGPYLIKAITEFQRRTGLEPDGYFGPLTLAKLEKFGFKK